MSPFFHVGVFLMGPDKKVFIVTYMVVWKDFKLSTKSWNLVLFGLSNETLPRNKALVASEALLPSNSSPGVSARPHH